MMRVLLGTACIAFLTSTTFAEDIVGTWRYIDDKTGEAKGLVKI